MNEFKRLRMYYFWKNSRFSCLVKVVFLLDRIASTVVNDLNGSRNISAQVLKSDFEFSLKIVESNS
jgi:hypothetical protein